MLTAIIWRLRRVPLSVHRACQNACFRYLGTIFTVIGHYWKYWIHIAQSINVEIIKFWWIRAQRNFHFCNKDVNLSSFSTSIIPYLSKQYGKTQAHHENFFDIQGKDAETIFPVWCSDLMALLTAHSANYRNKSLQHQQDKSHPQVWSHWWSIHFQEVVVDDTHG